MAPVVSCTNSIPACVCSQQLWELIFLALEVWAVGLGPLAPKMSLVNFFPPNVGVGPVHSTSATLLPVWMDVVFNSVDFHST